MNKTSKRLFKWVGVGSLAMFFSITVCCSAQTETVAKCESGKDYDLSLPGKVKLDLIWIEPGTFVMGTPKDESGRNNDETQHQVTLSKGYWLGKYEVIQPQWKAVMGSDPSHWQGEDLPVEQVSWYEAMKFCEKLTMIEKAAGRLPEGYVYTLPTEAQWEYACRAGTTGAYNVDGATLNELGWHGDESQDKTHAVGQKKPNACGLYDMHGNVWEWCLDWYGDYPEDPVTDPVGKTSGSGRVDRGGSWGHYAGLCRSGDRNDAGPGMKAGHVGFRLALAPAQSAE
jgi:formylglycine-generating enzyme required for sulfatase activity